MSVFIELTTDSFATTFNQQIASSLEARAGTNNARRPLRGLEVKEDTYAIIKVVRADGTELSLFDSSSKTGRSTQYSNFILQSVSEARMEKHQIVETFGEPYIFFFGESPRFLDVTAILVDSNDFNWYAEFWKNYDEHLRGTKLVEQGARTYLFYDDNIVEGYMLMAQARKIADQPMMAQLTFRLYLTNYSNVSFVGDPNFPIQSSVAMPLPVTLTAADEFSAGGVPPNFVGQDVQNAALYQQANQSAAQQTGGFGGAQGLADALRQGLTATGNPSTDSSLQSALQALGINTGAQVRTAPLRSLIADDTDEYTASAPSPLGPPMPSSAEEDQEADQVGQPDAPDLPTTAVQQAQLYGANINNPDSFSRLGMGPNFTNSNGFGIGGSAGFTASFGVTIGAGPAGQGYGGGINGGLGFTGALTAASVVSAQPSSALSASAIAATVANANYGTSYGNGVYGNGIPIQSGVVQGTGVGGGIPFGLSAGIGPNGPGSLGQFVGGGSYSQINGFGSTQGYGSGLSANGASISVGGSPSLFASSVAEGTLDLTGSSVISFFTTNGVASDVNTSGYIV